MFHIYEGFHLVDAYHKMRYQRKYNPDTKRAIKIALVAFATLLLWNMPTEWYGIDNLTVIQQRVIAIFAFATLMWILEIVSSWATSVAIIVLMLLFCSDSGIAPMVNEEEVGKLLSYKGVMASFADPVIMLFIGGFVLAIDAANIVALNVDISSYAIGRYTVTVENSQESFTGEFETQTTGIEEISSKRSEVRDYIYNLQGQRLTSLQKGLNIVNGKKVYVK